MFRSLFFDDGAAAGAPAAAPVVPAAPAAAPAAPAAAPVVAPLTGTPIERATAQMRERMAQGEKVLPVTTEVVGDPAAPAADPAAPVIPAAEPDAGAGAPDALAEAVAGDEPAAPAEPALAEGMIEVELPNRQVGASPVKIVTDDPEVAERIRQLSNSYMRRADLDTYKGAVDARAEEVEEQTDLLRIDPFAFNERHLSPAERWGVAMMTLLSPENWNEATKDLLGRVLNDDNEARSLRSELKAARLEAEKENRNALAEEKQNARQAAVIVDAIKSLAPAIGSVEQRELFINDCRRAVSDYIKQHGTRIQASDVPVILAARLRVIGRDPETEAARLRAESGGRRPNGASAPAPAGRGPLSGPALVKANLAKKAVASVAAPGAGAPAATMPTPPKGALLKDAHAVARAAFKR